MLQSFRKYTQGWLATLVAIIISLAFVFWGIENYFKGNSKNNIVAKVNGRQITQTEVNNDFQRMILRIKEQGGSSVNLPSVVQQDLKSQILNGLIMKTVLEQSANKTGFKVTSQQVSSLIKQMPLFQNNGQFSKLRFAQIIDRMGYSKQEFFIDVAKSLALNQVAAGVIGSAFVLPNELSRAIKLVEQKRDFDYVFIPAANFKKEVKITQEQIKSYYNQHKDLYRIPAKIQMDYIELQVDDLKKATQITDQDLNDYFNTNTNLDRNNPTVVASAKEMLSQQKAEQNFLTASDKLADLVYTNPNSLVDAANALKLKIKTTEFFSKSGGNSSITKHPKIIATAFDPDLLKNHVNSNVIELSPGHIIVLHVKEYKQEEIAPLAKMQEKIRRRLVDALASGMAKENGLILLSKIDNANDFKNEITAKHLAIISKQNISRHEKNINPEILKLAFSIAPSLKKPLSGLQLANGDYVVILVKKSVDPNIEKISNQQRMMMAKLYTDTYGKLDYNLYIENQLAKAKIKTYSSSTPPNHL